MEEAFLLLGAGVTSLATYIIGVQWFGCARDGLWRAIGRAFECIGLTLVFFLLNLVVGMIAVLAVRSLMGRFVPLYIVSDTTLLMLSLFQALTFQAWREDARHRHTSQS
jgi:type IV secretory pathway VirB3-like protein